MYVSLKARIFLESWRVLTNITWRIPVFAKKAGVSTYIAPKP